MRKGARVLIGYARVSTQAQDLAAQVEALQRLDVDADRIYVEKASGRSTKSRPQLEAALSALRPGDVFVVTKLDRLSRSVVDSHRIAQRIAGSGASLQIDRSVHDPSTPMGKFFYSILATFAEFEADVASQRTKEGLAIARSRGRLNGKPPKLSRRQHLKLLDEYTAGDVTVRELAQDYGIDRATVYRTLSRAKKMREEVQ